MKREKIITLCILVLITWLPYLLAAWDKDLPDGDVALRTGDDDIRTNNTAIETALDQDHDFTTGSTQTGRHNMCTFLETANLGTGAEGVPILGAQTAGGKAELTFTDEDDNDIQLTSKGNRLANDTYFTATNNAGSGSVNLFKATTGDALSIPVATSFSQNLTMANSKSLTVETLIAVDSTGLLLQNDTPATVITIGDNGTATLADSSQLATSAAPTADADIANKKYVDDQIEAQTIDDETQLHNAAAPTSWTDKDISGTIGSISALCLISVTPQVSHSYYFRKNGSSNSMAVLPMTGGATYQVWIKTDSSGIFEWYSNSNDTTHLRLLAYKKIY